MYFAALGLGLQGRSGAAANVHGFSRPSEAWQAAVIMLHSSSGSDNMRNRRVAAGTTSYLAIAVLLTVLGAEVTTGLSRAPVKQSFFAKRFGKGWHGGGGGGKGGTSWRHVVPTVDDSDTDEGVGVDNHERPPTFNAVRRTRRRVAWGGEDSDSQLPLSVTNVRGGSDGVKNEEWDGGKAATATGVPPAPPPAAAAAGEVVLSEIEIQGEPMVCELTPPPAAAAGGEVVLSELEFQPKPMVCVLIQGDEKVRERAHSVCGLYPAYIWF